jgi:UDP-GlcNAc:undecaprenyl-phosphate GlcNAc-1-phosphate transferase
MISDELRIITVFLCSLFGALFVLPKLAHIAKRIGLIDQPNKRKVHVTPRPLVGGIGIVIAATFSSLAFIPLGGLRGYFLGLSVLLFIGFLDDFKEVGHKQKFIAQIGATVLLIYFSKVSLSSFGDLLGIGNIHVPGGDIVIWCVTAFCVVGVINSINLIDGLDGLAGGISFTAFVFFGLHASFGGNTPLMLLNFALAGAVLGFLKFNWHPSVLFMGDAGSLCLGFTLGFMALGLTQGEDAVMPPVAALMILAVPITDTLVIMCKRALKGSSPFMPDKYHLHHIFMRYGMGRLGAVKAILGLSFLMGAGSLLSPIYGIPEQYLFAIFGGYFFIYTIASFYIPFLLRYSKRFKRRKPKAGEAHGILKILLGSFDSFKIFRKAKRHNVYLRFRCKGLNDGQKYEGKVLDFSVGGCMAYVKDLTTLNKDMILTIYLPFEDGVEEVKLTAEHIWISEKDKVFYHGFKFEDLGVHEHVIESYLSGLSKKPEVEVVYTPS